MASILSVSVVPHRYRQLSGFLMFSSHFASVFGPGLHFNLFHLCVTYSVFMPGHVAAGFTCSITLLVVSAFLENATIMCPLMLSEWPGSKLASLPSPINSPQIIAIMYTWIVVLEMPKRQFPDNLESFEIIASNPYCARKLAMKRFSKYAPWWCVKLKTWGP